MQYCADGGNILQRFAAWVASPGLEYSNTQGNLLSTESLCLLPVCVTDPGVMILCVNSSCHLAHLLAKFTGCMAIL